MWGHMAQGSRTFCSCPAAPAVVELTHTPPPQPGRSGLRQSCPDPRPGRHPKPKPNPEQVYELFSRSGELKRVIMGLDRYTKTPCGFCFVEFHHR